MDIRLQHTQNTEILISQTLILGEPAKQFIFMRFFQKKKFYQWTFAKTVRINLSYEETKVIGLEFGPHNPIWFFSLKACLC